MMKNNLGLYIHIPFCKRRCLYCDFTSSVHHELMEPYGKALMQELVRERPNTPVTSIFFGGGTPSLLPLSLLEKIVETIYHHFAVQEDAEITLEANPESVSEDKLRAYRSMGINRLSFGVQSLDEELLNALGRLHTADEAIRAVELAELVGFEDINVDLMMALPGQTMKRLEEDVKGVLALEVPHISYYSLILEEGTPLAQSFAGLEEELERRMYHRAREILEKAGFHHYEISNWAKPRHECRHNLRYWQLEDYRGFGVAAHSSVGDIRFYHGRDIFAYIQNPHAVEGEIVSSRERLREHLIMGIRLIDGVDLEPILHILGKEASVLEKTVKALVKKGLVKQNDRTIALTSLGMDLCNRVELELYQSIR